MGRVLKIIASPPCVGSKIECTVPLKDSHVWTLDPNRYTIIIYRSLLLVVLYGTQLRSGVFSSIYSDINK